MSLRRMLVLRCLALTVVVLLAGAFLAAPATAQHRHEGDGLYNPDCPLAALAAVERQGGVVVTAASTVVASVVGLVVASLDDRQAVVTVTDLRFRAPPTR